LLSVEAGTQVPGSPTPKKETTVTDKPPREEALQGMLDEALELCRVSQESWQAGELEKALDSLDQAYGLILNIEVRDDAKLVQQKEDLRFTISRRILEIYASRNIVVNGHHNAIPMAMNEHVRKELDRFTKGNEREFFINSYKRSGLYRPYILKALKENGIPEELSWLPLIESGFKVRALSRARALGLWQFIPSTGYKFGLKRNKYIDERLDPEKATEAAIAYLRELHQMFGDWATVLAAYNCGENRVLRVIREQNVNYLDNFWDLYERLPRETARYVPRFLATLHILKNPEEYGMDGIEPNPAADFETVSVSRQVSLKDVADSTGIFFEELRELNPELRYGILPPEDYPLRLPAGKGRELLAKLEDIPVSALPVAAYSYHRVRSGETLSTIAKRYGTSVRKITRANNIRKANFIVVGQKLKIPRRGTMVPQTAKAAPAVSTGTATHRVKRGDSLWNLARRYGTTTRRIQALNNLRDSRLHVGQVLMVPGAGADTGPETASGTYRVRPGDSPYSIAKRYDIPLNRFLSLNGLTPKSTIFPGQSLSLAR